MDPENVCNDQLVHLDKKYMLLYSCKYMDSPDSCNKITPPIVSQY